MRIVIDARMYGPERWTGIGRYLQHLLVELEDLDRENEYVVLVGRENFDEYHPKHKNFRKIVAPFLPYSLAEQVRLPGLLRSLKPDLVHFAAPNAPLFYSRPHVTTVHDLTLLFYSTARGRGVSKWLHEAKRLPFRLVMRRMVRGSTMIFTPTKFVKEQLVERYRIADSRVAVTPLAMDPPSKASNGVVERFGLSGGNYVLYVGNCYPYKNVDKLVDAFGEAAKQADLRLVMVGRDDYFRELLKARVAEVGLTERVVFTGAVSDEELAGLYARAKLYVNPSLSEGFGLQGLEAMTAGVPVLAARASSLPEVYGEAAEYFDPLNGDELARGMTELLDDKKRRAQLVARGHEQAKRFSWQRTAEQTLAAYKKAATGRPGT